MALLVNGALLASLVVLLNWRDLPSRTAETPTVEIVARLPEPPPPKKEPPPSPTPQAPLPQPQVPPPPPAAAAPPPALLAPPPEPAAARSQTSPAVKPPNTTAGSDQAAPPPASPAATPPVLSAPQGDATVPVAAPTTPAPTPAEPAAKALRPDLRAQLEAALPVDTSHLPASFRAVLSGGGPDVAGDYHGLILGRLGRAHAASERARAAHLEGMVVVAFTIADDGSLADLHVVQSSGRKAVDEVAMDMVREAAPFPPPPADVPRTYTPALLIGGS